MYASWISSAPSTGASDEDTIFIFTSPGNDKVAVVTKQSHRCLRTALIGTGNDQSLVLIALFTDLLTRDFY
ncbi:unnamed protein product [Gongylonema pulchrum]|uniref:Sema domain-containing protein n=1 Tax=Gongylonema pulchrum TaxID=637853 RepID=A0A183EWL5_9BILA|nr:unnamed protein product [Gongylonema pulchrum]